MAYYHETREQAVASGAHLKQWWSCSAQLEPYNGWVLVMRPRTLEVFKYPVYDLLSLGVIDVGQCQVGTPPANKKRGPSLAAVKAKQATERKIKTTAMPTAEELAAAAKVAPPPPPPPPPPS